MSPLFSVEVLLQSSVVKVPVNPHLPRIKVPLGHTIGLHKTTTITASGPRSGCSEESRSVIGRGRISTASHPALEGKLVVYTVDSSIECGRCNS